MKKKNLVLIIFIFLSALGIFVPGFVAYYSLNHDLNVVNNVPEEFYKAGDSIFIKNNSKKLSEANKLELISGKWESRRDICDISESEKTKTDIIILTKNRVAKLYKNGDYNYVFDSSYGNWYSWDIVCYRCTDTAFHSYSAYCYIVTLYKNNSDEFHKILITPSGTILAIYNNIDYDGNLINDDYIFDNLNYYVSK